MVTNVPLRDVQSSRDCAQVGAEGVWELLHSLLTFSANPKLLQKVHLLKQKAS